MHALIIPFERLFIFSQTSLIIFERVLIPLQSLNLSKDGGISTNLVLFLAIILVALFASTANFQPVKYIAVFVIGVFSFKLILSIKKEGFAAALCVLLGCATILGAILVSNDTYLAEKSPLGKLQLLYGQASDLHRLQISGDFLHLYSLFIGGSCILFGLIFAYRPSLVQVKNFIPYEYPYPIWNNKIRPVTRFSKNLVSTKELLTDKERMLLCRFRYLLVSIDGDLYLVSPNDMIPADSIIMRTKSGNTLCGISRFR